MGRIAMTSLVLVIEGNTTINFAAAGLNLALLDAASALDGSPFSLRPCPLWYRRTPSGVYRKITRTGD